MTWTSVPSGKNELTHVDYDRRLELRVRYVGNERYSVSLMRCLRYGPGSAGQPIDVYAVVVKGSTAASQKSLWIKENIDNLLDPNEESSLPLGKQVIVDGTSCLVADGGGYVELDHGVAELGVEPADD